MQGNETEPTRRVHTLSISFAICTFFWRVTKTTTTKMASQSPSSYIYTAMSFKKCKQFFHCREWTWKNGKKQQYKIIAARFFVLMFEWGKERRRKKTQCVFESFDNLWCYFWPFLPSRREIIHNYNRQPGWMETQASEVKKSQEEVLWFRPPEGGYKFCI